MSLRIMNATPIYSLGIIRGKNITLFLLLGLEIGESYLHSA